MTSNPYDELPYKSAPIEWTAPERLALVSFLHGGPRAPLDSYRVLELGCADGSNLLPLAWYRRHGRFTGVDGARSQIDIARSHLSALGIANVEFVHSDFLDVGRSVTGQFDFIVAHGVFSWIPPRTRDVLLEFCAQRLAPNGLLYLNYNTFPGWSIRSLVRDFLLAQTADAGSMRARTEMAQDVAATLSASPTEGGRPYAQLITEEFRLVSDSDPSYVAHEYLAADNHAFWRSEFLTLAGCHGLEYVADADFNYSSGRLDAGLTTRLAEHRIYGRSTDDTVDLLSYRQLHSPILARRPVVRQPPTAEEFSRLLVASCLAPPEQRGPGHPMFQHPSGYQVEVKDEAMRIALERLHPLWPRGITVGELFGRRNGFVDDLCLLYRHGLVELRCVEPSSFDGGALHMLERARTGFVTTAYHTTSLPMSWPAAREIRVDGHRLANLIEEA